MLLFLFSASVASKPKNEFSFNKCDICHIVAKVLSDGIAQGLDDSQIHEKLNAVCAKAPKFLIDACDIIVDTYYNKLIKFLRGGESVKEACTLTHLCSATNGFRPRAFRPRHPHVVDRLPFKKVEANVGERLPFKKVSAVSNGAPVFQTETSPTWSKSWEEDI